MRGNASFIRGVDGLTRTVVHTERLGAVALRGLLIKLTRAVISEKNCDIGEFRRLVGICVSGIYYIHTVGRAGLYPEGAIGLDTVRKS